jgi:zinc-ribbon domain
VTEPLPPLAGPGERLCPACGEPNGDTRRFCVSCGAKLPAAAPGDQADPADRDRPAGRRPRTWRQRARAASRGPLRYTEGFSAQVKARAVMAVLALVAGVVALAGPARERALALVGWGPSGQAPVSAELITGQGESGEEVAGFAAANVYDDDRETGVAIVWEPATGAEPQRIRVTLEEPVDVRKLQIAPGLADEAEDAPLVLKPSRIRVCANTGACQEISLDGSASLQTHRVDLGEDVETIDLAVLDVQDTEVTTYPLAVISEIRVV